MTTTTDTTDANKALVLAGIKAFSSIAIQREVVGGQGNCTATVLSARQALWRDNRNRTQI
jgi:hypothetical protein